MGNVAVSFVNRAYEGTITGGSFQAGLPASNAGTPYLYEVSRTVDATTGSTKWLLDMGVARAVRVACLVGTNLSSAGQIALDVGTTSGGTDVYNGSLATAWPMATSQGLLASIGQEQDTWRTARNWIHPIILPQHYTGRYVTLRASDTGNAAGYLQAALLYVGGLFVPAINPEYQDADDGVEDLSTVNEAEHGAEHPVVRPRRRTARFGLKSLTQAEADVIQHAKVSRGITQHGLYLPDVADLALCQRFGFVGRMRQLSRLENPWYLRRGDVLEFVEAI